MAPVSPDRPLLRPGPKELEQPVARKALSAKLGLDAMVGKIARRSSFHDAIKTLQAMYRPAGCAVVVPKFQANHEAATVRYTIEVERDAKTSCTAPR